MLAMAVRNTRKLIREKSASDNVRLGRFFTKRETAAKMASMFTFLETKPLMEILDPGAGTGILSAALLEAVCLGRAAQEVRLVCYENDPLYLPMLKNNLDRLRRRAKREHGVKVNYEVREENFLLAPHPEEGDAYDCVIMNPPRELLSRGAPETLPAGDLLSSPKIDACYLFLAAAALRLKDEGQLTACLPVGFATGVTLTRLREALFDDCRLTGMHLFRSEKGLKKDFLLSLRKTDDQGEPIAVSVERASEDGTLTETLPPLPYQMIVREDGAGLLLLQNADDLTVLRRMAAMPRRFSDYGLRMKTGLTLPSRYPDLLSDKPEPGAVPLIHPRSLGSGRVTFPAKGLHGQFIRPSIPSLIQKNRNMLFLKRFPAKTDPRKLICAVYMASQAGGYRFISTHNKLNYVDREGDEMDPPFLVGLYAALSGTLYNRYVSIVSRSEQINATEFSDLPLPDETTLRSIGSQLLAMRRLDPEACDYIFEAAMKTAKRPG